MSSSRFIFLFTYLVVEMFSIEFIIVGPSSQPEIECSEQPESDSVDVVYHPTGCDLHAVHVLCDGEDVHGSPFMADIQPASSSAADDFDVSQVQNYAAIYALARRPESKSE